MKKEQPLAGKSLLFSEGSMTQWRQWKELLYRMAQYGQKNGRMGCSAVVVGWSAGFVTRQGYGGRWGQVLKGTACRAQGLGLYPKHKGGGQFQHWGGIEESQTCSDPCFRKVVSKVPIWTAWLSAMGRKIEQEEDTSQEVVLTVWEEVINGYRAEPSSWHAFFNVDEQATGKQRVL